MAKKAATIMAAENKADKMQEEMRSRALVEFRDEYAALAALHSTLLRDVNLLSATNRRTCEILEYYRELMAQNHEAAAKRVGGENSPGFETPTGSMIWTTIDGWRRKDA